MSESRAGGQSAAAGLNDRGIWREVMAITVPSVVTMSTRMLMDVTDFIMVTIRGDHAGQAALLPSQMIMWTVMVVGVGTVSMVATYTSQCLGRGRQRDCGAYGWQGIYIAGVCQVAGFGLWFVLPTILGWLEHDPEITLLQLAFCNACVWTIGPTIAAEAFASFFNGVHRPKVTMWTVIESVVINALVSWPLMFGLWGLPGMGIVGAAWGMVAAMSYRTLRLAHIMLSKRYDAEFATRHSWRPDRVRLMQIVRTGVPQSMQWCSDVFVWTFFVNYLVGTKFGTLHLTASNIVWNYMRVAFVPCLGVGRGLSTLVGKAIGQGDFNLANHYTRLANAISLGYMGALSVLYLLLRHQMVAIFNADPQIVQIGAGLVICAVVFLFFDGLGITYGSALRGAGDTLWPAVVQIIGHWVILISGGWLVAEWWPHGGSLGPWAVASLLIIVLSLVLWYRWAAGTWRKIDLFKDRHAFIIDTADGDGPSALAVERAGV